MLRLAEALKRHRSTNQEVELPGLVPGQKAVLVEHRSKLAEVQSISPKVKPGVISPTAIRPAGLRTWDSVVDAVLAFVLGERKGRFSVSASRASKASIAGGGVHRTAPA